eukprot:1158602-Pelagomonas_calceolata.AAC.7
MAASSGPSTKGSPFTAFWFLNSASHKDNSASLLRGRSINKHGPKKNVGNRASGKSITLTRDTAHQASQ